jgi:MYXO-CTERM domain-containing protein
MTQLNRPCMAFTIAALTLSLSLPALAGNVVARAGQNPQFVEDNNPGASASANWLDAAIAHTTRTRTAVSIDGTGATASFHHNAAASHITDYQLWDLDTNTAVETALAQTALLDFGFRLTGLTVVAPQSLSSMTFQYSARLTSAAEALAASSVNVVFGPVPGNINGAYLFNGDLSLYGSFDQSFALRHSDAAQGRLNMLTAGLAANAAASNGQLMLNGVTFAGPWSGGSLGIRFVETGEIIVVSAIPEPGTWALWLAGLGVVGLLARRREQAR